MGTILCCKKKKSPITNTQIFQNNNDNVKSIENEQIEIKDIKNNNDKNENDNNDNNDDKYNNDNNDDNYKNDNNNDNNNDNINNDNNNYNILIINKNKGKKNFEDKSEKSSNHKIINGIIDYNNESIDSKTRFKKSDKDMNKEEKKSSGESSSKMKKFFGFLGFNNYSKNNYFKIIFNYLNLHEKLNNENNINVYIINKKDNDDIIKLYNEIINNNEYKLNIDNEEVKIKIIEKIVNKFISSKQKFNNKITICSYEECFDLKDELIDLIDSTFCKDMGINEMKGKEALYINDDINSSNKIIKFYKNKKRICIEKRNEQYFLRKFLDEEITNDINKNQISLIEIKPIKESNNDNYISFENNNTINEKNFLFDKEDKKNKNEEDITIEGSKFNDNKINIINNINNSKLINEIEDLKFNEKENLNYIIFKILLLFNY